MPSLGPADNDTTINFGLTATINEWYELKRRSEGQGIDWRAVYGPMMGAHPERFFDSISNGTLTQEKPEQRKLQMIADLALKRVEEMEQTQLVLWVPDKFIATSMFTGLLLDSYTGMAFRYVTALLKH